MARLGIAKSGRTPDWTEGLAGLRPSDVEYIVRRTALTGLAIGALIAGVAASSAALQGVAESGVEPGNVGERVISVTTTGYGWRQGIRAGQVVLELVASDDPGGWRIKTAGGAASAAVEDDALRQTTPIAIGALAAALLSMLFLFTRRRWVYPGAAVAILAASITLRAHGEMFGSTAAMAAAAFVPLAAYGLRLPRRLGTRWFAIAAVAAALLGWAALRLAGDPQYDQAEVVREIVAFWATIALVVERGVIPAMTGQSLGVLRPRLLDGVMVALLAAIAVVLSAVLSLPWEASLLGVLVLLAFVPATRRRLGRPIEDILLADVREQAAAEATERERARLARELHDVPLQELVAVIRRLEIKPGTESESDDLRALAGHLRNVATELRPPVLDDLGLAAALDFLAEQAATSALPVSATVDDDTGFGPDRRPPTDVELAMYRIASEAVGNAVRHSGGSTVRITASVAPDRVELSIVDDGAGLASEAARDAARRKRLGLVSMRRRAEAIDAELSIEGSSSGTRVRAVWQA